MTDTKLEEPKTSEGGETPIAKKNNTPLIIAVVVAGVLAVALVGSVAALVVTNGGHRLERTASGTMRQLPNSQQGSGGYGSTGDQQEFGGGRMRGGTGDSSTRVSGVVTAVNGDTLTVAGNGKTTTVKKTDSTTVRGTSTTVAVNDTVMISGETANDVFTATSIVIRNITN